MPKLSPERKAEMRAERRAKWEPRSIVMLKDGRSLCVRNSRIPEMEKAGLLWEFRSVSTEGKETAGEEDPASVRTEEE